MEANYISAFSDTYDLKSLIKEPTCCKKPNKPSCIDLILTNQPRSSQHSCVIETGLSDFHKMTVTVMKTFFERLQPRVVNYRDQNILKMINSGLIYCQNLVRQI